MAMVELARNPLTVNLRTMERGLVKMMSLAATLWVFISFFSSSCSSGSKEMLLTEILSWVTVKQVRNIQRTSRSFPHSGISFLHSGLWERRASGDGILQKRQVARAVLPHPSRAAGRASSLPAHPGEELRCRVQLRTEGRAVFPPAGGLHVYSGIGTAWPKQRNSWAIYQSRVRGIRVLVLSRKTRCNKSIVFNKYVLSRKLNSSLNTLEFNCIL